jgi:hypothetical protein
MRHPLRRFSFDDSPAVTSDLVKVKPPPKEGKPGKPNRIRRTAAKK